MRDTGSAIAESMLLGDGGRCARWACTSASASLASNGNRPVSI
jgi:hypothetical protein